ncbi:MAG: ice-binding family protein [Thermoleophilia bacterium]
MYESIEKDFIIMLRYKWGKYMKVFNKTSVVVVLAVAITLGLAGLSSAATTVNLGTADSFAVLAGTAVTNVPTSVITGNVGLSPAAGTNYAGLTMAEVSGTIYAVDVNGPAGAAGNNPSLVNGAKSDLTAAYLDAAGRTPTHTFVAGDNQLGGQTLTAGVYAFGHATTANITAASPLTLDAQGDPNAVFIFQASSDLVTASNSVVRLANGAQACNVFWQVTSSVTLGTSSTFVGNVLALTSITDNGYSTISGSLLARNGQVALNHTTINDVTCAVTRTPTPNPTPNPNSRSFSNSEPVAEYWDKYSLEYRYTAGWHIHGCDFVQGGSKKQII